MTKKSMLTWLKASLPRGARPVHGYLKAQDKAWAEYFETKSGIVNTQGYMMKHFEDTWASWWTPNPQQARRLKAGLNELRSLAMASPEEHPPLELRDVARACTRFSATAAIGVDLWKL
eukprot:1430262-Pyramimonas_sp.AAC.1